MMTSYTVLLSSLLTVGVLAKNSKLNQYASISDCQNDANIISHASPAVFSCHGKDSRTVAVYLVTGDGAAGSTYHAAGSGDCKGDLGAVAEGQCTTLPDGTGSIQFGPY